MSKSACIFCPGVLISIIIVNSPSVGTLFFAAADKGSYEISFDHYDELLKASSSLEVSSSRLFSAARRLVVCAKSTKNRNITICRSVEAMHSPPALIEAYVKERVDPSLKTEYLELDSQCKYALVARGDADAYVRISDSRAKIWVSLVVR